MITNRCTVLGSMQILCMHRLTHSGSCGAVIDDPQQTEEETEFQRDQVNYSVTQVVKADTGTGYLVFG